MKKYLLFYFLMAHIIFAQGDKDYLVLNKEDWISGIVKLDVSFHNGAFYHLFGILIGEDRILTSSKITSLGFPLNINVKLRDKEANLIICIAKADLLISDEKISLALLKIKHYTDDYCNFSPQRLYHKELLTKGIIDFKATPRTSEKLESSSPFLIINHKITLNNEEGIPYFDKKGELIGISSHHKIIDKKEITRFLQDYSSF